MRWRNCGMKKKFATKNLCFDKFITVSINPYRNLFYKTDEPLTRSVYQNIAFILRIAKQQGVFSVKRNVHSRVSYIQVPWRDAVQNLLKTRLFQKKKKRQIKTSKQILPNRKAKLKFVPFNFTKIIKNVKRNNAKIKTFHLMFIFFMNNMTLKVY